MAKTALLVIDVQNDFVQGGSLAVPDGAAVVAPINALINSGYFDLVVASRDWHPRNHVSFAANHGMEPFTKHILRSTENPSHTFETTLWPAHCVEETKGAEFVPGLDTKGISVTVFKGNNEACECYSAFSDVFQERPTFLSNILVDNNIKAVTVVGLALDFCVLHTALDAVKRGFATTVILDATRAITEEGKKEALETLRNAGVALL